MKKFIFCVMAAAAVLACSKSEVPSIDGGKNEVDQKYVIYAEDVNTRTVTDASFNVSWTNNDNLAVYTWPVDEALPADAAAWRASNPVNFVASDGSASPKPFSLSESDDANSLAGKDTYAARLSAFKERYGDGTANLQWGVIYPGRQSNASKPGMGIVSFGNMKFVKDIQNGNNDMTHLALQDVLCGTATGSNPTVEMHHLGTMMVYTVKNETSSEFTVNSIKISVPAANIGGDFRVNVFDGTFDSCMTALNECTLWVNNGTAIPAGGSADFYQVLAPFDLATGKTITMTVTVNTDYYWTKTITLSKDMNFESGKRNPTTITVDAVKEIDPTLKTHEDTEVNWFSTDSNLGRYLDMTNGKKYLQTDSFNQADVDIVIFRGNNQTALTFAAPIDSALQQWIDNSIKEWTTINATTVKKVAVDFDSITKLSELQSAYEAASDEGIRCVLDKDETAIVKTVDGNYALIKVIGGDKYDKTDSEGNPIKVWGNFKLSVKTVE